MGVKVFIATVWKELQVRLRAYPVSFMVSSITTGIYTNLGAWLMYHCFFERKLSDSFSQYTGTVDYMSYVIIGSCTYMFVVRTCLNVSRTLVTELREGTLDSLMLAPFHRSAYFLGNMALQTVTTFFELLISVLIGFLFGLQISSFSGWRFVIAVLLSLYGFFGISMMLGCLMLYTRNTYITQNTLFSLIFLLCGITFPKEYLPAGLQQIGNLIPVTDAVDLLRSSFAVITDELHQQVKELAKKQEKGILLTSHYLAEVEELCDYIYLLSDGELLIEGTKKELTDYVFSKKQCVFSVRGMDEQVEEKLRVSLKAYDAEGEFVRQDKGVLVTSKRELTGFLAEFALREGYIIQELYQKEPSLENAIIKLSKEAGR